MIYIFNNILIYTDYIYIKEKWKKKEENKPGFFSCGQLKEQFTLPAYEDSWCVFSSEEGKGQTKIENQVTRDTVGPPLRPSAILFRCKFSPFLKDQAFVTYFDPQSLNPCACTQTEQGIFSPLSLVKPSCLEVKGSHSKNKTKQSKTSLRPIVPTLTVYPKSPLLFLPLALKRITGKIPVLQLNSSVNSTGFLERDSDLIWAFDSSSILANALGQ